MLILTCNSWDCCCFTICFLLLKSYDCIYGSYFPPSGSVCSNDSRQSQQSLHSPTSETTTFQLGHYDTDSGHNSIVSSNYDSHSSSSISSTNSPPVEKRPPAIVVAPNMAAMVTVTSASTSVPQCQVGSSAAVRSTSEFPGCFVCTAFVYIVSRVVIGIHPIILLSRFLCVLLRAVAGFRLV